jgi:hypothetical protein
VAALGVGGGADRVAALCMWEEGDEMMVGWGWAGWWVQRPGGPDGGPKD